jgi:hypothetical protein
VLLLGPGWGRWEAVRKKDGDEDAEEEEWEVCVLLSVILRNSSGNGDISKKAYDWNLLTLGDDIPYN